MATSFLETDWIIGDREEEIKEGCLKVGSDPVGFYIKLGVTIGFD